MVSYKLNRHRSFCPAYPFGWGNEQSNLRPARWPQTTHYEAQVVLDNLLTAANDIRAGGASRGGV